MYACTGKVPWSDCTYCYCYVVTAFMAFMAVGTIPYPRHVQHVVAIGVATCRAIPATVITFFALADKNSTTQSTGACDLQERSMELHPAVTSTLM